MDWEKFKTEREKMISEGSIHKESFLEFGAEHVNRMEYENPFQLIHNDGFIYPDDIVKHAKKTKSGFPKILWRTYKNTNLPEKWKEGFESGFLLKDWTYIFMTDEDNLNFVKRHYPSLLPLYENFEYPIQRVDLVRVLYLHRFGGLYSDLDKVFLTDFSHFFEENATDVFLVRSPNVHSQYTNSFMASKPNAKFWIEFINAVSEQNLPIYAWGRHMKVMWSTGPSILTRVVNHTNSVITKLPGIYFESCSVCEYPCKASIENGQYVKQIEGSSWIGLDTKVYLCFLCSWPQMILILVFIFVLVMFTFFV